MDEVGEGHAKPTGTICTPEDAAAAEEYIFMLGRNKAEQQDPHLPPSVLFLPRQTPHPCIANTTDVG